MYENASCLLYGKPLRNSLAKATRMKLSSLSGKYLRKADTHGEG